MPTRLAESDYILLNSDLNLPVLLTTTDNYDTSEQNMEQAYIERIIYLLSVVQIFPSSSESVIKLVFQPKPFASIIVYHPDAFV